MSRLTDDQRAVRDGLAAGDRIVGPRTLRRPHSGNSSRALIFRWSWDDGRPVHANVITGMLVRGLVETRPAIDAEHEIVLRKAD